MIKKYFLIAVFLFSVALSYGQEYKRYQYKSGYIKYNVSGMSKGTEEVWFDDYGMKELKISNQTVEMMGISQKTNTKTLMVGNMIYTVNLDDNTGTKMENPLFSMFPKGTDLEEVGKEMMENLGGKISGTGEVLGKTCEIWEVEKVMSKVWVWNSIPLKTEANMMGMNMKIEAESMEMDVNIPSGKFDIPTNVNFTDMGNMENYFEK